MGEFIAGAPQGSPLLQQARLTALERLDLVEIVLELESDGRIVLQNRAVGTQKLQNIGAEGAIFLRDELACLAYKERRARRDLGLRIAGEQLVEFDEAIDEIEGNLRAEHRVLGTADARRRFEDRQTRLLDTEIDGFSYRQIVVVRVLRKRRQPAQTDVVKAIGHRTNADARRQVGKKLSGIVTLRPETDLPPGRALQFFIRKHSGTSWRTMPSVRRHPDGPALFRRPHPKNPRAER